MNNCENCGKGYEVKKHTSKTQRFCSTYCRVDFHQKKRSQEIKKARINTCSVCGAVYSPGRSKSSFCSNACRQSAYRNRKRDCKESKPFLLECFRLPADEWGESPLGYRSSSLYTNGIGFDMLIEEWEGIPSIKEKVKIVKCNKNERLDRQELYFTDNPTGEYPFFILSNDSILKCMPMDPGEKMMSAMQTEIILEYIGAHFKSQFSNARRMA